MNIRFQKPFSVWHEISRIAWERFPDEYDEYHYTHLLPYRFTPSNNHGFIGDLFKIMIKGAKSHSYKPEILSADAVPATTESKFFDNFRITDDDLKAADAFPQIERLSKVNDVALVQRCINLFNYSRVTRYLGFTGDAIRVDGWGKKAGSDRQDTLSQAKSDAEAIFAGEQNQFFSPELANYADVSSSDVDIWFYDMCHSVARFAEGGRGAGKVTAWGRFQELDTYDELDHSFVSGGKENTFYRLFTDMPIEKNGTFDFDPVPQQKEITVATGDKKVGYEMDVYAVIDRGRI